jgi:hypothetical protein
MTLYHSAGGILKSNCAARARIHASSRHRSEQNFFPGRVFRSIRFPHTGFKHEIEAVNGFLTHETASVDGIAPARFTLIYLPNAFA